MVGAVRSPSLTRRLAMDSVSALVTPRARRSALTSFRRQFTATVLRAARRRLTHANWRAACGLFRFAGLGYRDARVLARLGRAAIKANDYALAIMSLRGATALSPRRAVYHARLGSVFRELGCPLDARECAEKAIDAEPSSPHGYVLLAELYATDRRDRNDDRELDYLQKALTLSQSRTAMAHVLLRLAIAYTDRANRQATIDCCLRAIAVRPESPTGYSLLAETGFYRDLAHPHIALAEGLLCDSKASAEEKQGLHFALGCIYDRHAKWKEAFSHFRRGNAIARKATRFDHRQPIKDADRRIAAFTSTRIEQLSRHGVNSDVPIFVIGMPRSGTTLIEQMLHSHHDVSGLGERTDLLQITQWLPYQLSWTGRSYPECIEFLTRDVVCINANNFLAVTLAAADGARRAVTKHPNDFWELGLIHILFPNAKVIHCRRDPRDTCLSCYMQDFASIRFASDLDHIACYYRQYERMMNHWRTVLRAGVMYELQYEDLVRDPIRLFNQPNLFTTLDSLARLAIYTSENGRDWMQAQLADKPPPFPHVQQGSWAA